MKKTYNSPAFVMVQLNPSNVIAVSMGLDNSVGNTITDSNEILVKGNSPSDVNVWDNEW